MSENQNIEAKLCSYVEGDLDPEGRAEIEKYLLTNPQYRPLIEELSRTRGLLRKLPRESAPAELLETLSGQIERSALLGDDAGEGVGTRTTRLPHLAAWAAVLVLTGGLAAVIYRVLPSTKSQSELALLKPAPAPPNVDQSATSEAQKAVLDQDQAQVASAPPPPAGIAAMATAPALIADQQLAAAPASQSLAQASAATSPTVAIAAARAFADAGDSAAQTASASGSMPASANSALAGSIVGGDATQLGQNMYVTLRATDAKAAGVRVTQYLNDNGIAFESRSLDAGARLSAGPLQPPALSSSYGVPSVNSNSSMATPRMQPASVPNFGAKSTDAAATAGDGASGRAIRESSTSSRTIDDAGQGSDFRSSVSAPDAGSVIFARNLTAEQARRLTTDLDIKISQTDVVGTQAMQSTAMQQAPLAGAVPLQVGERVRVVARDNGLPGVEAMDEALTIDADGNLTLPLVGKVKAAGLTAAELADKIPQAYHDAKSPTTATWTIDRVAATLPTTEPAFSLTAPTNAPASTAPADALVATTSPLAAPNQGIDVAIQVVATTLPATQQVSLPSDASTQNAMPMVPAAAPAATLPTSAP